MSIIENNNKSQQQTHQQWSTMMTINKLIIHDNNDTHGSNKQIVNSHQEHQHQILSSNPKSPIESHWDVDPHDRCHNSVVHVLCHVWKCVLLQWAVPITSEKHSNNYMGLSENRVYSQWNNHLIGIMIINHWVQGDTIFRHTHILKKHSKWKFVCWTAAGSLVMSCNVHKLSSMIFNSWMKSSLFWVDHGEHVHGDGGDGMGCSIFTQGRIHSFMA